MSGGASAATAIDAPNIQPMMISDAHQARVGSLFALTGITCPTLWCATDDWFVKSTEVTAYPDDARHIRDIPLLVHSGRYSLGTQDAIDAERVELHSPPNESHHDRLRLQV